MSKIKKLLEEKISGTIILNQSLICLSSNLRSSFFWADFNGLILKSRFEKNEFLLRRGQKVMADCKIYLKHGEIIIQIKKIHRVEDTDLILKEEQFLLKHRPRKRKKVAVVSNDKIALICPPESKAYSDFKALGRKIKVNTTVFELPFGRRKLLLNLVKTCLEQFDKVCLLRGGGPAYQLLALGNDLDLCEMIYKSKGQFIVALGHADDHSILEKMTPFRFHTPSSLALALSSSSHATSRVSLFIYIQGFIKKYLRYWPSKKTP